MRLEEMAVDAASFLSVEDRIGDAMSEAAASITITVLTDVFSIALGILTNILAVQIFCPHTTAPIVTTLFYQLTIMMAVQALTLRVERTFTRLFNMGTGVDIQAAKGGSLEPIRPDFAQKMLENWYVPVLMHRVMRFMIVVSFILYLAVSIWFCTNLREGLEPSVGKKLWNYGTEVQVVVNNPPDVSEEAGRLKATMWCALLREALTEWVWMELRCGCSNSSAFWVELKLPNLAVMSKKDFYESLRHFLEFGAFERFVLTCS
ncbi:Patched domain containing protein, partial [Trichuris trichiura]